MENGLYLPTIVNTTNIEGTDDSQKDLVSNVLLDNDRTVSHLTLRRSEFTPVKCDITSSVDPVIVNKQACNGAWRPADVNPLTDHDSEAPEDVPVITVPSVKSHLRNFSTAFSLTGRVDISWSKLVVEAEQRTEWICYNRKPKIIPILDNVSGYVESGSLLAILGPSGSGKSTLLNTLAGRDNNTYLRSGRVCCTGGDSALLSSYVQQDDMFIETLTVWEHLVFQASLKLSELTFKEQCQRVRSVVLETDLCKVVNSMIGSAGVNGSKSLSGGERKRLSLASEILLKPRLLFCDEPTSGLDAFTAEKIVSLLKKLTERGTTVIVTIHQPSSDVFQLFDHLCLLSQGQAIYFGPLKLCSDMFKTAGYQCPEHYNPADHYLKVTARGDEKILQDLLKEYEKSDIKADLQSSILRNEALTPGFNQNNGSGINPLDPRQYLDVARQMVDLHKCPPTPPSRPSGSILAQFSALLVRNSRIVLRNPVLNHIRLAQHVIVALFVGLSYYKVEDMASSDYNISGAIFLSTYMLSLLAIFNNIQVLPTELPLFVREYQSKSYYIWIWYISKVLVEIPASVILPVVYSGVSYFLMFRDYNVAKFFVGWLVNTICVLTSVALSFLVSVIGWDPLNALAISPAVFAPFFLHCGMFIKLTDTPDYMLPFQATSWLRYGFEASIVNHFSDIGCENTANNTNCSNFAFIEYMGLNKDALLFPDITALIILCFVIHLIAFLILYVRARLYQYKFSI